MAHLVLLLWTSHSLETVTKFKGGVVVWLVEFSGVTVTKSVKTGVVDPTWVPSTLATILLCANFYCPTRAQSAIKTQSSILCIGNFL